MFLRLSFNPLVNGGRNQGIRIEWLYRYWTKNGFKLKSSSSQIGFQMLCTAHVCFYQVPYIEELKSLTSTLIVPQTTYVGRV